MQRSGERESTPTPASAAALIALLHSALFVFTAPAAGRTRRVEAVERRVFSGAVKVAEEEEGAGQASDMATTTRFTDEYQLYEELGK